MIHSIAMENIQCQGFLAKLEIASLSSIGIDRISVEESTPTHMVVASIR